MNYQDPSANYFEEYKDLGVNAYKQGCLGDNKAYYFGVWKGNQKLFGLFSKISGSQAATKGYGENKMYECAFNLGLKKIKKLIDKESYAVGADVQYWVNE